MGGAHLEFMETFCHEEAGTCFPQKRCGPPASPLLSGSVFAASAKCRRGI